MAVASGMVVLPISTHVVPWTRFVLTADEGSCEVEGNALLGKLVHTCECLSCCDSVENLKMGQGI